MRLRNLFENISPDDASNTIIQILEAEKGNWRIRLILNDTANPIETVSWTSLSHIATEAYGSATRLVVIEMSLHSSDIGNMNRDKIIKIFTNNNDVDPTGFHDEDKFHDVNGYIAFEFMVSSRQRLQQYAYDEIPPAKYSDRVEADFSYVDYDQEHGPFDRNKYPLVVSYLENLCREAIRTINDILQKPKASPL